MSCNCNNRIVDGKGRCVILRKKILWVLAAVSVTTLALAGCGKRACGDEPVKNDNATELAVEDSQIATETEITQENTEGIQTLEVNEWGLTLHAKDVTSEGMMLVCTQSGGSPTGELNTGSYYSLEKNVEGVWRVVEYTKDMEIGWTAEAWIIPMNDTVEWEEDWEWLYGNLEPGHYRIGKEITDFRASGDFDKAMYYAEFEIEE